VVIFKTFFILVGPAHALAAQPLLSNLKNQQRTPRGTLARSVLSDYNN
jgi:hypothetical protein